jgi:beta-galactosidase
MGIRLGAAWYPEHWDEVTWRQDLKLMREAGLNVVRIAEFAWADIEPSEGHFALDWLERAVSLAAEHGLDVVMGTPTAAPPAWLTQAYPEVLAVDEHGRRAQHGKRCHYDVTSSLYQKLCARVVEELARRFGPDERVIGWQIDNEYNRVSFSEQARRAFQEWLQGLYVDDEGRPSLAALNSAWTTSYWSQKYTSWSQIPLPAEQNHNPALILRFHQFVTEAYCRFQRLQLEIIRRYARPGQWITSNFMGFFHGFDHYRICEELDLASWDHYIGTGHLDLVRAGAAHDLTRGFKRRNFWVMETQPGCVNWAPINNMLDRGEARAMAWNGIGRGADAVLYWQWRSALNGQEQYHGTLVAPDGTPRPFYQEVKRLSEDLQKVGDLLDGQTIRAEVALLHSYDDRWAIEAQRHHRDFDPLAHYLHYYRCFAGRSIMTDIISSRAPLSDHGYKLVIGAPVHIIDEAIAAELKRFASEGGHLVLSIRSGFKDAHNRLHQSRPPALLQDAAGMYVEEYYALLEPVPLRLELGGQALEGQGQIWAEWLTPLEGTQVLARYGSSNGWLDGQAAVTAHPYGAGWVYYVGAWLDERTQAALMGWIAERAGVRPVLAGLPENVAALRRGDAIVVVSARRERCQLSLPGRYRDQLTGRLLEVELELEPYGVAVLVPA